MVNGLAVIGYRGSIQILIFSFLLACAAGSRALAVDLFVDNVQGKDTFDGRGETPGAGGAGPFATIRRALETAVAGDTVRLNRTGQPYRQMADFYGLKGGTAGKPIVLDGQGALLYGADPCPSEGWTLYRHDVWMRRDVVPRGFIIVNGEMVFFTRVMGVLEPGEVCFAPYDVNRLHFRPPAGRKASECEVEVGQPDGTTVKLDPTKWQISGPACPGGMRYNGLQAPTWVRIDGEEVVTVRARDRLAGNAFCVEEGVFYYRTPAGSTIGDLSMECVMRENGVQMSGDTAHVTVRNLDVRYVSNDGFNIHGHVRDAEFHNCNAFDCGDEGFSAHDACETLLDGAVFQNCCNGIANVNTSGWSVTRHVIIARSREVGFLIQGEARHELSAAILIDNPSQFSGGHTLVSNVLVIGTGGKPTAGQAFGCGADVTLQEVTAAGHTGLIRVSDGSSVAIRRCLFAAGQGAIHARTDAPFERFRMEGSRFGTNTIVEWGARHPWKTQPVDVWMEEAAALGRAKDCGTRESPWAAPLCAGEGAGNVPAGVGCRRELIDRYLDYRRGD